MKVRSLSNIFTNYFRSIATIHSYNARQATKTKYYHSRTNKKNGNINKTYRYAVMEQFTKFASQVKVKIK